MTNRWMVAVVRAGVPFGMSSQSRSPVIAVGAATISPKEMASNAP
jgi:hypothetical protein